ncbi:CRISPR-associated endonuclease Cas1 [Spirochaeta dissipatitropha]
MESSRNRCRTLTGPLLPGKKIQFTRITELGVDGYLDAESLQVEVEHLQQLDQFHLRTLSPLRMTSPNGKQHGFFDPWYLRSNLPDLNFFRKLLKNDYSSLEVVDGAGIWLDMIYNKNCIGGFTGCFSVHGTPDRNEAEQIIRMQYFGAGKSTTFGFGRFYIPELDSVRAPVLPQRRTSLLSRAMSLPVLREARHGMKESSPGSDSVDYSEFTHATDVVLSRIGQEEADGTRQIGEVLEFKKKKSDSSGHRKIQVFSSQDKLVLRSYSLVLSEMLECHIPLLHEGAIAFRHILSRKKATLRISSAIRSGMRWGFKVDLRRYFDSVPSPLLLDQVRGLFPLDPFVQRLEHWMDFFELKHISGLPQGSPLSPALSNLYLTPFDRDFTRFHKGLYYRYADDIIFLTHSKEAAEEAISSIDKLLSAWQQELNHEKTIILDNINQLIFLGFYISADKVEDGAGKEREQVHWRPPYLNECSNSKVIYVTHLTSRLHTEQNNLVLEGQDGQKNSILWKSISQIHVIGKTGFSSHFMHRAMRDKIPVFFCNATGQRLGRMVPDDWIDLKFYDIQKAFMQDAENVLQSAKNVVSSKLYNSAATLEHFGKSPGSCLETLNKVATADNDESLRGYEGSYGRYYFSHFAQLVEPFDFQGRSYHPPKGEVNSILSFGYTLLYNRISAALSARGMNPRIGFFHVSHGAHDALASDIMESFRFIVDELIIELIQTNFIVRSDFDLIPNRNQGLFRLNGDGFRKFLRQFELKMHESRLWEGDITETPLEALQACVIDYSAAVKLKQPYTARRRI